MGEQMSGVHAIAAPVRDHQDTVIAAVSVPFVTGVDEKRVADIKQAVIAAAQSITNDIRSATPTAPAAGLATEKPAPKHSAQKTVAKPKQR
jgi:transcriptional regulator of acetoin/glycerol metabolism